MCKQIPLYDRFGKVRDYATVDDEDFERVAQYRWCQRPDGYAVRAESLRHGKTRIVRMHRFILGLSHGDKAVTDHINRTKTDNRKCNLRITNQKTNSRNRAGWAGKTSRYRGVCFWSCGRNNGWRASMVMDGRQAHIGIFASEIEAANIAAINRFLYMHRMADDFLEAILADAVITRRVGGFWWTQRKIAEAP